jgi:hypothetical protein
MSRPAPPSAAVLALYREGVETFADLARRTSYVDGWKRVACGSWTADDLVRHELDVIGWYHGWLDRALAGDASPAWPVGEIDRRTAAGVQALAHVEPDDAVAQFVTEAGRYAERVEAHWDLPFGYPRGTVTAGLHAGMAAAEWHLHAWDLAGALGTDHRPDDAGTLLVAAASCVAAAGGLRERAQRAMAPVAARMRPWETLLTSSGRRPRRSS